MRDDHEPGYLPIIEHRLYRRGLIGAIMIFFYNAAITKPLVVNESFLFWRKVKDLFLQPTVILQPGGVKNEETMAAWFYACDGIYIACRLWPIRL